MLGKLLKYDLKFIYKNLPVFYIIAFVSAGLAYLLPKVSDAPFFAIAGTVCQNVTLSMAVTIIVNGLMRCWINFQQKFYGDPAYLTHTLPVSRRVIYGSKFLAGFITAMLNFSVCILVMIIAYGIFEDFSGIIVSKFSIFATPETPTWTIIAAILLTMLMELMVITVIGYACTIAAYNSGVKKNYRAVLTALGGYLGTQIIIVLAIYIAGLMDPEIMVLFKGGQLTTLMPPIYIALTLNTLITAGFYITSQRILARGVNVI